jgi:hypothetical protein
MSTEAEAICDGCKEKIEAHCLTLTEIGLYRANDGLFLMGHDMRRYSSPYFPILDFCDLNCLDRWCKERITNEH